MNHDTTIRSLKKKKNVFKIFSIFISVSAFSFDIYHQIKGNLTNKLYVFLNLNSVYKIKGLYNWM
jgi:hypothetical protein